MIEFHEIERLMDEGIDFIPVRNKVPPIKWSEPIVWNQAKARHFFQKLMCDVAFPTGKRGDRVAMDYDTEEAKEYGLSVCKPTGTIIRTPSGGEHHLYKYPGVEVKNAQNINGEQGCDRRADGGYRVGPPTPGYTVIKDEGMETYDLEWFRAPMASSAPSPAPVAKCVGNVAAARAYASHFRAKEGSRDHTAFRVACLFVQKFLLPPEVALEELRSWNAYMVTPPLPDNRIVYKIQQALKLKR